LNFSDLSDAEHVLHHECPGFAAGAFVRPGPCSTGSGEAVGPP
jgi:hypothetical protein